MQQSVEKKGLCTGVSRSGSGNQSAEKRDCAPGPAAPAAVASRPKRAVHRGQPAAKGRYAGSVNAGADNRCLNKKDRHFAGPRKNPISSL
jgi:hypothetical protein